MVSVADEADWPAASVVDVFVSKATNLGESDLIVVYRTESGDRFALLIEDKIDAPMQPDQANRYRLRAEKEVGLGKFAAYEIVLCAPEFYIKNHPDISGFDQTVSFEEIATHLAQSGAGVRLDYRAAYLTTAGTRRLNAWKREADEKTDAFWMAVYQLATREFPILGMKRPKVARDQTWVDFRPMDMPTMPKRTYIRLKGDRGQIDLTFSNTTAHRFCPLVAGLLGVDMTIHQTAKSAAIRIEADGFEPSDGKEAGIPKVREAFTAAQRLIEFYRLHRSVLERAAQEATPT